MIDKFSILKKDFNKKFVKQRYVDDLDLGLFWGWIIENFDPKVCQLEPPVSDDFCGIKHIPTMYWYKTDCGEHIGELCHTYTHRYCPFCGKERRYLDNTESKNSR